VCGSEKFTHNYFATTKVIKVPFCYVANVYVKFILFPLYKSHSECCWQTKKKETSCERRSTEKVALFMFIAVGTCFIFTQIYLWLFLLHTLQLLLDW